MRPTIMFIILSFLLISLSSCGTLSKRAKNKLDQGNTYEAKELSEKSCNNGDAYGCAILGKIKADDMEWSDVQSLFSRGCTGNLSSGDHRSVCEGLGTSINEKKKIVANSPKDGSPSQCLKKIFSFIDKEGDYTSAKNKLYETQCDLFYTEGFGEKIIIEKSKILDKIEFLNRCDFLDPSFTPGYEICVNNNDIITTLDYLKTLGIIVPRISSS